jgi:hypothetical protein
MSVWHELPRDQPEHMQECWVRTWWFTAPFRATWYHIDEELGWIPTDLVDGGVPWFLAPFWRAL